MSAFVISIKSDTINNKKMKYYITRFLNSENIKSRYLLVDLSFFTENNTEIQIGKTLCVDRKDKFEVKSFNFLIIYSFNNQKVEDKVVKVVFKFKELSKDQYVENKNI